MVAHIGEIHERDFATVRVVGAAWVAGRAGLTDGFLAAVLASSWPLAAEPTSADQRVPRQHVEMLWSKKPLTEIAPVPFTEDEQIQGEVDAEICASYRHWHARGNRLSEHMEQWCPTDR